MFYHREYHYQNTKLMICFKNLHLVEGNQLSGCIYPYQKPGGEYSGKQRIPGKTSGHVKVLYLILKCDDQV